ncbi:hypothetical protein SDC9_138400 [bioreactor metagenome]|uniref:Uncharacterized protein n=1 Tax=bioreactor metagenome TaxID=1076179 RepID=A0A645DS36_9ZZZZ
MHGNVQFPAQRFVPVQSVDVEQHGAGGIGIVRHMDPPAGEVPDEPGVHRAA